MVHNPVSDVGLPLSPDQAPPLAKKTPAQEKIEEVALSQLQGLTPPPQDPPKISATQKAPSTASVAALTQLGSPSPPVLAALLEKTKQIIDNPTAFQPDTFRALLSRLSLEEKERYFQELTALLENTSKKLIVPSNHYEWVNQLSVTTTLIQLAHILQVFLAKEPTRIDQLCRRVIPDDELAREMSSLILIGEWDLSGEPDSQLKNRALELLKQLNPKILPLLLTKLTSSCTQLFPPSSLEDISTLLNKLRQFKTTVPFLYTLFPDYQNELETTQGSINALWLAHRQNILTMLATTYLSSDKKICGEITYSHDLILPSLACLFPADGLHLMSELSQSIRALKENPDDHEFLKLFTEEPNGIISLFKVSRYRRTDQTLLEPISKLWPEVNDRIQRIVEKHTRGEIILSQEEQKAILDHFSSDNNATYTLIRTKFAEKDLRDLESPSPALLLTIINKLATIYSSVPSMTSIEELTSSQNTKEEIKKKTVQKLGELLQDPTFGDNFTEEERKKLTDFILKNIPLSDRNTDQLIYIHTEGLPPLTNIHSLPILIQYYARAIELSQKIDSESTSTFDKTAFMKKLQKMMKSISKQLQKIYQENPDNPKIKKGIIDFLLICKNESETSQGLISQALHLELCISLATTQNIQELEIEPNTPLSKLLLPSSTFFSKSCERLTSNATSQIQPSLRIGSTTNKTHFLNIITFIQLFTQNPIFQSLPEQLTMQLEGKVYDTLTATMAMLEQGWKTDESVKNLQTLLSQIEQTNPSVLNNAIKKYLQAREKKNLQYLGYLQSDKKWIYMVQTGVEALITIQRQFDQILQSVPSCNALVDETYTTLQTKILNELLPCIYQHIQTHPEQPETSLPPDLFTLLTATISLNPEEFVHFVTTRLADSTSSLTRATPTHSSLSHIESTYKTITVYQALIKFITTIPGVQTTSFSQILEEIKKKFQETNERACQHLLIRSETLSAPEQLRLVQHIKATLPDLFHEIVRKKEQSFDVSSIPSIKQTYQTLLLLENCKTVQEIGQGLDIHFFQTKKEEVKNALLHIFSTTSDSNNFKEIAHVLLEIDSSENTKRLIQTKLKEIEHIQQLNATASSEEIQNHLEQLLAVKEKYQFGPSFPAQQSIFDTILHACLEESLASISKDSMQTFATLEQRSFSPERADFYLLLLQAQHILYKKHALEPPEKSASQQKIQTTLLEYYAQFLHKQRTLSSHQLETYTDIVLLLDTKKAIPQATIGRMYEDAAELLQTEIPDAFGMMRLHAKCARNITYDETHPLHALDKAIAEKEQSASIPGAGVYFSELDTSDIKGGTIHIMRRKVAPDATKTPRETLFCDFEINHVTQTHVADSVQAIEETPRILFSLLPESFCQEIEVKRNVPSVMKKCDPTTHIFLDEGVTCGTETQIIVKGVGTIRIPSSSSGYFIGSKIFFELDPVAQDGALLHRLQVLLSMLGLGSALAPRRREDEEREKILFLTHTFAPRSAYGIEREDDTWKMSPEQIRHKIESIEPSMAPIFEKYLTIAPHLLEKVERVNGKRVLYIKDMGSMIEGRGCLGFVAGAGSDFCKALNLTRADDKAKFKEWFKQYIKNAWQGGRGIALSSNAIRYLHQGSFAYGSSAGDDMQTGGFDCTYVRFIPKALTDVPDIVPKMSFCSRGIRLIFSPDIAGYSSYAHAADAYGGRSLSSRKTGSEHVLPPRYDERDSIIEFTEHLQQHALDTKGNPKPSLPILCNEFMVHDVLPLQQLAGIAVSTPEQRDILIETLEEEGFIQTEHLEGQEETKYFVLGSLRKSLSSFIQCSTAINQSISERLQETRTTPEASREQILHIEQPMTPDHDIEVRKVLLESRVAQMTREKKLFNQHTNKTVLHDIQEISKRMPLDEAETCTKKYEQFIDRFHQELISDGFSAAGIEFSGHASLNRELLYRLGKFASYHHLDLPEFIMAILVANDLQKLKKFDDGQSTIASRMIKALEDLHPIVLAYFPLNKQKLPSDRFTLTKEYERLVQQEEMAKNVLQAIYAIYQSYTGNKPSEIEAIASPFDSFGAQNCSELLQQVEQTIQTQHARHGDSIYQLAAHYSLGNIKSQSVEGFTLLTDHLAHEKHMNKEEYRNNSSLDTIISDFIESSTGIESMISHLFWDRLHLLVGIGNPDVAVRCHGETIPYRTVIEKLATALDSRAATDPKIAITRQQLQLRLMMIQEELTPHEN